MELIQVHKWGFYAMGQIIGKVEIVNEYCNPKHVQKTLLTSKLTNFDPDSNPYPPTEEVFRKHKINIYVP